uniref:Uncharacterized protein n=1 Tax=Amphilophus citrinellus TaxID=61819 RepID=A0A3Q0QPN2_AMPCI
GYSLCVEAVPSLQRSQPASEQPKADKNHMKPTGHLNICMAGNSPTFSHVFFFLKNGRKLSQKGLGGPLCLSCVTDKLQRAFKVAEKHIHTKKALACQSQSCSLLILFSSPACSVMS